MSGSQNLVTQRYRLCATSMTAWCSRSVPFARAKACVIVLGSSTWCATCKSVLSHWAALLTPKLCLGGLARQVYAPGFFNNYGTDKFPAVTDALCHSLHDSDCVPDWPHVRVEIARTAEAIREAVDALRPSSLSFRSTD